LGVKSKKLNNNLGIQLSPRHFCRGLFCFQEITTKESKSLKQNRYTNKISFFGTKLKLFFIPIFSLLLVYHHIRGLAAGLVLV
jgi:hypothetical protein